MPFQRNQYVNYAFIIIIMISSYCIPCFAQDAKLIKSLESSLKQLYGLEKLKAYNTLTAYYEEEGSRKALKYGRLAVGHGENLFDGSTTSIDEAEHYRLITSYVQLGRIQYNREQYVASKKHLEQAKALSLSLNHTTYHGQIEQYLTGIDQLIEEDDVKESFFSKKLNDLHIGKTIDKASKDVTIRKEITLAQLSEKQKNFQKAFEHYEKALMLLKEKGDKEGTSRVQLKMAILLDSLDKHDEIEELLDDALTSIEVNEEQRHHQTGVEDLDHDEVRILKSTEQKELNKLKNLFEKYAATDEEKALKFRELYQSLSRKMETDSLRRLVEKRHRTNEIFLLKQQKEIANLNVKAIEREKAEEVRLRNSLIAIAVIMVVGIIGVLYFYLSKKRQHETLTVAYEELNETKGKLENAEQRIVKLLSQQVSGDVAMTLLTNSANSSDALVERRFVCIMFLDIRGFTPIAEKLSPEALIDFQNRVFGFMIDIVLKQNGIINQLLGDGFMATFGAPVSRGNDCQNAYQASKEILAELKKRVEEGIIRPTRIGIGLHAGNVVTGNVGTNARKQYSITGNPVIIASRVEQLNKEYNSQLILTEEVYEQLDDVMGLEPEFLEVNVKGRSTPARILTVE